HGQRSAGQLAERDLAARAGVADARLRVPRRAPPVPGDEPPPRPDRARGAARAVPRALPVDAARRGDPPAAPDRAGLPRSHDADRCEHRRDLADADAAATRATDRAGYYLITQV